MLQPRTLFICMYSSTEAWGVWAGEAVISATRACITEGLRSGPPQPCWATQGDKTLKAATAATNVSKLRRVTSLTLAVASGFGSSFYNRTLSPIPRNASS
jgi:hypothetical protein